MNIPKFNNKDLFAQVFVHRSYLNEEGRNEESNERLEFLGDSILSFIVSSYIYEKYPELAEGELTNLRSALTNTLMLYQVAKKLDLGKYLKLSKGEEESRGRENKTILANTLEALIGGLYLDSGLEKTRSFIEEVLLNHINTLVNIAGLKDPKSKLQEEIQARFKASPVYKIIKEEGPDHLKKYTVGVYLKTKLLATGTGNSKQDAEKQAAKNALSKENI
ncbi:MAG: ribonuclease III [Candidatus Levybacteria bacterium RIFCSPHIGHO2_01_FULL_36_15]|nr:MAG: ribonuclease III [Candidatus Levybacteria bacterium RIFCSPHIGHO2_01_FULL_36_15]OGH39008.1 MAG: ribonuclease III [Candidatus Levybacteria bacterium RIFCSPLOWO2_01_FULL_36_10]